MTTLFADNRLANKNLCFLGDFAHWPAHYRGDPRQRADAIGAHVQENIDETTQLVVLGAKRKKGRAVGIKKAEALIAKGVDIDVIDEETYIYLTRPQLTQANFVFAGGFEFCPDHITAGGSYSVVESVGGRCASHVDDTTNFLVIGEKRGKGKAAVEKAAKELEAKGQKIERLSEAEFLELIGCHLNVDTLDYQGLVVKLINIAVGTRLSNAMKMLREENVNLYSDIDEHHVSGIVQSQSSSHNYSCTINSQGEYGCCEENLEKCWSSQDKTICKHLLVLILGLVRSGQLEAPKAFRWLKEASAVKPTNDESQLAKTLVRYKGMQQGELDWRPTETMPEDFMAF